jgi:outer membrane protein assembly factor BamA
MDRFLINRRYLFVSAVLFFFLYSTDIFSIAEPTDTKSSFSTKNSKNKKTDGPAATGNMAGDVGKFGQHIADRIDRVVNKKGFELWGDPWTMQGIPIIIPGGVTGFNLGLRWQAQNLRRQDPHQAEVIAQILSSDRGRYKHLFQLDFPWLFKDTFRITGRFAYDRDISLNYYGIGNDTTINRAALDGNLPLYDDTRSTPSLSLQVLRYFGRNFRMGPLFGFKWTTISYPTGSLLESQQPVGVTGGRTHSLGLAFIYDTLDFEPYPSSGNYVELFLNRYDHVFGSDYDFTNVTITYRKFIPLHRRLIFAHRTLIDAMSGDAPYYELGSVSGTYSALGFGGDRFLRGYDANRFIDKIKVIFGFELRWDPLFLSFAKQDLTVGFVSFLDIGRVYPQLIPFELGSWHPSGGWGLRLIWNSRLVVRFDLAVQDEMIRPFINIGNAF